MPYCSADFCLLVLSDAVERLGLQACCSFEILAAMTSRPVMITAEVMIELKMIIKE